MYMNLFHYLVVIRQAIRYVYQSFTIMNIENIIKRVIKSIVIILLMLTNIFLVTLPCIEKVNSNIKIQGYFWSLSLKKLQMSLYEFYFEYESRRCLTLWPFISLQNTESSKSILFKIWCLFLVSSGGNCDWSFKRKHKWIAGSCSHNLSYWAWWVKTLTLSHACLAWEAHKSK